MKKNSKLSLALVGLVAAIAPGLVTAPGVARTEIGTVPYNRAPLPATTGTVPSLASISNSYSRAPLNLETPTFSRTTQFYANVPRFRGYRNGRPRGRRSYRSAWR